VEGAEVVPEWLVGEQVVHRFFARTRMRVVSSWTWV
jgi:hypothetical protein